MLFVLHRNSLNQPVIDPPSFHSLFGPLSFSHTPVSWPSWNRPSITTDDWVRVIDRPRVWGRRLQGTPKTSQPTSPHPTSRRCSTSSPRNSLRFQISWLFRQEYCAPVIMYMETITAVSVCLSSIVTGKTLLGNTLWLVLGGTRFSGDRPGNLLKVGLPSETIHEPPFRPVGSGFW